MAVRDPLWDKQRRQLEKTVDWARRIGDTLRPLVTAHGDRVHFRPSCQGVAMIGLLSHRPQRGRSGLRRIDRIVSDFETLFAAYCREIEQGRPTAEKALQSFLIREAQTNCGHMRSIEAAASAAGDPVELVFVTDEIALPTDGGKIVCDILALRTDQRRCTPVLVELKTDRDLTRLIEQVDTYASLIDRHAESFTRLFSALTGTTIVFDHPPEKWIVWPASHARPDPHGKRLQNRGIRAVEFTVTSDGTYTFLCGETASTRG